MVYLHPTTRDRERFIDRCPHCKTQLDGRSHAHYDWNHERAVIITGTCRRCQLEYKIVRPWKWIREEQALVDNKCLTISGSVPTRRDADTVWQKFERVRKQIFRDIDEMHPRPVS